MSRSELWSDVQDAVHRLAASERRAHDAISVLLAGIRRAKETENTGELDHVVEHARVILGEQAAWHFPDEER